MVIVPNSFYTSFDEELLHSRSDASYRTRFQQDRDRIVHTSAFRRLQAKTQVFKSGEYDFYRTRLTHSIEVAQVGRGICSFLNQSSPLLSAEFHIDEDLIEACCLAHDIGHSPFGHAGETSLNKLMLPYGGFEGNGQTLRLVAQTIFSEGSERKGMSPTRAFLDGILKYKTIWTQINPPVSKFIYADQSKFVDFVANGGETNVARHEKSIECEIMDWADDTAYCLGDLMDGVRAKFITVQSIEKWRSQNSSFTAEHHGEGALDEICEGLRKRTMSRLVAAQYGQFIQATSLVQRPTNNMGDASNRYRFRLLIDPKWRSRYELLKRMSVDLVFRTPQVHQLEMKADLMLRQMFESYQEQYWGMGKTDKAGLRLLPSDTHDAVYKIPRSDSFQRARLICDHISGMSDDFAVRTYKRMFEPGFGSIVDLV